MAKDWKYSLAPGFIKTIWRHPEQEEDEIFLTNATKEEAKALDWKTKRLGRVAYNIRHAEINQTDWPERIYPIFAKESEADEKWEKFVDNIEFAKERRFNQE